ncbi:MAG: sulfatase-like hydrolase/transferase [Myxococcota bacterium]
MTGSNANARGSAVIAPGLALLVPVVVFTGHNGYPWLRWEMLLLTAVIFTSGLVLGCVGLATGLRGRVVVLATAVALATELHLMGTAKATKLGLALTAFVVVVVIGYVARERLFRVGVPVLAVVILTTPFAEPGLALITETTSATLSGSERQDLAPVVHLLLDEQCGIDGIPDELESGRHLRTALTDFYVAHDFALYTHAYSRYYDSHNAIANVLNLSSLAQDSGYQRVEGDAQTGTRVLEENAYFRRLTAAGYRIRTYQSSYMDFSRDPETHVEYALTYQINAIGNLKNLAVSAPQKAGLIFDSFTYASQVFRFLRRTYAGLRTAAGGSDSALPAWTSVAKVVAVPAVATLARLAADIAKGPNRGKVYFAHLTLPHYYYVYDERCALWPELDSWMGRRAGRGRTENSPEQRRERYEKYIAQSTCAKSLVESVFVALRQAGDWEDAIVVVHGDHGSRINQHPPLARYRQLLTRSDYRDAFATLFAIKKPGIVAGTNDTPAAVQDLLHLVVDGGNPAPAAPYVFLRGKRGALQRVPFPGVEPEPSSTATAIPQ